MIKMTRWRSCVKTPPKKDGTYLVVHFNKHGELVYAGALGYTLKWGWNTYNTSNEPSTFFSKTNKHDYAYLWTEITKVKGKRK